MMVVWVIHENHTRLSVHRCVKQVQDLLEQHLDLVLVRHSQYYDTAATSHSIAAIALRSRTTVLVLSWRARAVLFLTTQW